jgi:hypothetical protein
MQIIIEEAYDGSIIDVIDTTATIAPPSTINWGKFIFLEKQT